MDTASYIDTCILIPYNQGTVSRKREKTKRDRTTASYFHNNNNINNNNNNTFVSGIHLRGISKTTYNCTINQYELTTKKRGKKLDLRSRQPDHLPAPTSPITDVPTAIFS
jgi:hypothetical protein